MKHGKNFYNAVWDVKIDIDVARTMFRLSGFNVDDKSDQEVSKITFKLLDPYGFTIKEHSS